MIPPHRAPDGHELCPPTLAHHSSVRLLPAASSLTTLMLTAGLCSSVVKRQCCCLEVLRSWVKSPVGAENDSVKMVSGRLEKSAGPSAEVAARWRLIAWLRAPLVAEECAPQSWYNVITFFAFLPFSVYVLFWQPETRAEWRSG